MKIAVWHNLPSGGGKRALYSHVRGLVERGHTVESWCPSTADQNYLPLKELIPEHIIPFSWQPKSTKSSFNRLTGNYYNVVNKIKAMDQHCQQCAEEINSAGFDLLLANPCTFFRTTSIGRYLKIPKILYLQEPYRWLYESLPKLPWIALPPPQKSFWSPIYVKSLLQDFIKVQALRIQMREECLNAQAFDTILVNSLFSRESVLRAYGLDSKVCYLGIDTDLFRPIDVTKEKFVVGLGGIYLGKGVERAISALGAISASIRPDLLWVGNFSDKRYQKKMEKLANSKGVKVNFKVSVTDRELVEILNCAVVLIYTSRLEPFGFAPLEANACGTPVVAIAEGGIRETIKEGINGFLVNDNNPIAIAEAILKLLENPDLAQTMGDNARKYVLENWTWEAAFDRLERCLLDFRDQKNNIN